MGKLSMEQQPLQDARSDLILHGLIAWQKPLYQVLCLEPVVVEQKRRQGTTMKLGDILKKAMEEAQ
jgi:hypothetical protein